ncbi:hypothetical protein MTO96_049841 [Rhipicephalus appendiculatus]
MPSIEATLFTVVFLLTTFILWAARRRHKQSLLRRYGIPGPEPSLLFGNYMELKKDRIKVMEQWAQKYGKIYGFYEGEVAKVVIGDINIAKECFVKRAHEFIDRPPMSDCQKNVDDPVISTIRKILLNSGNAINDVCILVPSLGTITSYIFPLLSYGRLFTSMQDNLHQVLQVRKKGTPAVADIVQLMVEAQKNAASTSEGQNETITSASNDIRPKASFIKDTHIVSNCFVFLVAGYETTASTLAFALYELARHPEEQRRLHDELMSTFPDKDVLSYEDLHALKRFDAVIRECLRLYPPLVLVTSRMCTKDTQLASGHIIPKGSHIILPTWNVLHDADLWSDPYVFNPDRFSERLEGERLAASTVSFGFGPRECIGKRLALLELKAVLSKLIRKYQFSVCDETQIPMRVKVPLINVFPEREIVLGVEVR